MKIILIFIFNLFFAFNTFCQIFSFKDLTDLDVSISINNYQYGSPARIPLNNFTDFTEPSLGLMVGKKFLRHLENRYLTRFDLTLTASKGRITDLTDETADVFTADIRGKVNFHIPSLAVEDLPIQLFLGGGFGYGFVRNNQFGDRLDGSRAGVFPLAGLELPLSNLRIQLTGSYHSNGFANFRSYSFGVSIPANRIFNKDKDHDGLNYIQDDCPDDYGPKVNFGCPYSSTN